MSERDWTGLLRQIGLRSERVLEEVAERLDARFRPDRPLHIVSYRGYGNATTCRFSGRVLKHRAPRPASGNSLWDNIAASYARFATDEVRGVRVRATLGNHSVEVESDEEGYFSGELASPTRSGDLTSVAIRYSLPDVEEQPLIDGDAHVTIPPDGAEFGIISDVDDTIMLTRATSILRMMRLTLFESPDSRLAFDGVAALYEALHRKRNPLFYVSSSPWNLYEFLNDFMRVKDIVPGPLFLRDFGFDENKIIAGPHLDHKLAASKALLDFYPEMPFVLLGDSGQDDPEIYTTLSEAYPGRIRAIYIRDVHDDWRDREVRRLIDRNAETGVDMLLTADSLAAARHAAETGLIDSADLATISRAVDKDQSLPS